MAKEAETFVIKIDGSRDATWQGEVTWAEEKSEKHFRSALELIKYIDCLLYTSFIQRRQAMKPFKVRWLVLTNGL